MKITIIIMMIQVLFNLNTTTEYQTNTEGFGSIILQVESVDVNKGGAISAGIFTKEFFPQTGKATHERYIDIDNGSMEIVFDFIPAGVYGAAVYQDIDMDGALRTNLVGLPREPIGFSKDARIRFGPPAFSDAAFNLNAGVTLRLQIILR